MGHFSPVQLGHTISRRLLPRQQAMTSVSKRQKFTSAEHKASDISQKTNEQECTAPTTHKPKPVANLPLWQRLGPFSKAFGAYDRTQRQRPYFTVFCSSVVIYLCGDLAAQNIGGEEYEPSRTARNIVIGGLCSTPSYKWYV